MISVRPFTEKKLHKSRAAAQLISGSFGNAKAFTRVLKNNSRIMLTVKGRELSQFGSIMDLRSEMYPDRLDMKMLSDSLEAFFPAVETYRELFEGVFKRKSVSFVGVPSIEIPLLPSGEQISHGSDMLLRAWIEEILFSNICNSAEIIRDDQRIFAYYKGIPVASSRTMRLAGNDLFWDLKDLQKIFLVLLYFDDALSAGVFERNFKINIEDVLPSVLDFAAQKNPEAELLTSF